MRRAGAAPNSARSSQQLDADAPRLDCSWEPLERTYERSLVDLAALRFRSRLVPGARVPAAGLPWFMAMFGRDSLITSFQALPFMPELARDDAAACSALAARSRAIDPFRDEEPGKILHELRLGEMTAFEERPHSPYYGAADATPLFLILLDEYERWTGDRELVPPARARGPRGDRLDRRYGDRDGDGYIEYERRNQETGLENQCWKDSWDSIAFADGTLAPPPRATCEIQGYVYDAKRRTARLAREVWDDPDVGRTARAARPKRSRQRFNRDFWIDERGFFALALDGEKRKVDSLTSNIGHLLWSGIVDADKAEPMRAPPDGRRAVLRLGRAHDGRGGGLLQPDRLPRRHRLAARQLVHRAGACAATATAQRPRASRSASSRPPIFFHHRLPEAFAGYAREATAFPVEYPTACSPQAWATGAPLLLSAALLGLEVDGRAT